MDVINYKKCKQLLKDFTFNTIIKNLTRQQMENSLYLVNKKEATRFYLTVLKLVRILVKVMQKKSVKL